MPVSIATYGKSILILGDKTIFAYNFILAPLKPCSTQFRITVSVYVLVAIIKKKKIDTST
ncbi:uncharacterized protein METZ01_LOCUS143627 [marine metagenome]|uniref:Uncharacterized protein n=1 Tax=marine metagenome TaxID=408172 RepID=A0A381ZPU0_9ZZZZ